MGAFAKKGEFRQQIFLTRSREEREEREGKCLLMAFSRVFYSFAAAWYTRKVVRR
jgi:hypothetical protein